MLLPDEILSMIFLLLQPLMKDEDNEDRYTFIRSENQNSSNCGDDWIQYQKPATPAGRSTSSKTYRRPTLLSLGMISKQFRKIMFVHPIFTHLQAHRLFRVKKIPTLNSIMNLSLWINSMTKEISVCNATTIFVKHPYLLVDDLILMLSRISRPLNVKKIIFSLGWLCLGSKSLIKQIGRFSNVEELFLEGYADENVLHGINTRSIQYLARRYSKLKKLYIESYGGGSYNWSGYSKLLMANPGISLLTLDSIRDGINLDFLGNNLKNLSTLTINFSAKMSDNRRRNPNISYELFSRLSNRTLDLLIVSPAFKGTLATILSLKEMYFYSLPEEFDETTEKIIKNLLWSCHDIRCPTHTYLELYTVGRRKAQLEVLISH